MGYKKLSKRVVELLGFLKMNFNKQAITRVNKDGTQTDMIKYVEEELF
jgi:hypothetical protein